MIDWEEIIRAESVEELKTAKLWLFQENMRLENERMQLETERQELAETRDKFLEERVQFRDEMEDLNRRSVIERKRLKEENLFFDKKMAILQDGFRHLEEDRKSLEREKKSFAEEKRLLLEQRTGIGNDDVGQVLFRSVSNSLGLRKRYRDLVKIFHPDNLFGDEELSQLINKEYQRRRRED
ncbi:MAG: J domain-containing protein [Acetatifactor sp.]|nr:J domain-containing protein [Acetatifactor sp.]